MFIEKLIRKRWIYISVGGIRRILLAKRQSVQLIENFLTCVLHGGISSHYLCLVLFKKCFFFFLKKIEGFGGIPGPEAYQMKK